MIIENSIENLQQINYIYKDLILEIMTTADISLKEKMNEYIDEKMERCKIAAMYDTSNIIELRNKYKHYENLKSEI